MIELYLNNRKVDIDETIDIAITYKSTDLSNPTAIKNSFSKSVSLKGTRRNNEIFGQIFGFDRAMVEDDSLYGISFDPRKRVDFILYENSDIIEKGYFCLDTVSIENGIITYSITLYGQLGDFFYNLQYNDDGETMTLADLNYGFERIVDGKRTKMSDEKGTLFLWNKDFIHEGWNLLRGRQRRDNVKEEAFDSNNLLPQNWIVAAPTYNGLNDDFSNDVTLVYKDGVDGIPTSASTQYSNGWLKVTSPRELVEWESRDLRSSQQRVAVKTELVLNAISNPINNGGYEVVWDEEITDRNSLYGSYFNKSYILMDRLDFDDAESKFRNVRINGNFYIGNSGKMNETTENETQLLFSSGGTELGYVDTSSLSNGYLNVMIQETFTSVIENMSKLKYMTFKSGIGNKRCYGCIGYRLRVVNGSETSYSSWNLVGNDLDYERGKLIADNNGIDDFIVSNRAVYMSDELFPNNFFWCDYKSLEPSPITVSMKGIPKGSAVRVYIEKKAMFSDDFGYSHVEMRYPKLSKTKDGEYLIYLYGMTDGLYYSDSVIVDENSSEDSTYESGIYDGSSKISIQKMNVTKKILFGNGGSPFEYLTSFSKMLDLRFRMDSALKRVYIERRQNYYIDEVSDLGKMIDWSKSVTINPTLTKYKWYNYGFETPESYGEYLYLKRNKVDYGNLKVNTSYNFNSESSDVFENCIMKNTVPYRLSSLFFTQPTVGCYAPCTFATRYEFTTFDSSMSSTDSSTLGCRYVSSVNDDIPKLCCFDSDNSNMGDIDNAFVFYDGTRSARENENFLLSDNLEIMSELNDGACYIFGKPLNGRLYAYESLSSTKLSLVAYAWNEIPYFSKYISSNGYKYKLSFDFAKPNNTFIGDEDAYSDGITLYDINWKRWIENIYHKDCKSVELYCFLPYKPNEALRRFYYFNNAYWFLDEVYDYNATTISSVKCKFVKLEDYKAIMEKAI